MTSMNRGTANLETGTRRSRRIACGCLLAFLLAPAVLSAKRKEDKPRFEETTEVIQVEVPVNVVTRDGQPVRGLTAENFKVYDEGKLQDLSSFDLIDLSKLDAEAAEKRMEELPAVARRNFLLLFDFSFSTPASIVKARHAAHDFVLSAVHPSDLVAIATFSLEFGPQLLVTFTPDRAQLARAIDTLGLSRRHGENHGQDPLHFMIEPPSHVAGSAGDPEGGEGRQIRKQLEDTAIESLRIVGKQIERSQLNYERSRVTAWSRSLADLAKALNAVAGRKHVVYFSEGFNSELLMGRRPNAMGQEAEQEMLDRMQGNLYMIHGEETHGDTFLQGDVYDMLEEFRRADCLIQSVDIAGLRAGFDTTHARSTGSDSLFYLANETGGHLFEATNDLTGQLDRVLQRSQVTYVLSFEPKKIALDGKYHKLKVEVDAEGLRGIDVSHRAGYYAPRPFADLDPLEKSLLASDAIASAEPSTDVEMDVLAAPFRASGEIAYVPVIVEIQGKSLLTGQRSGELPVEIYAYVTDAKGEMRDYFSHRATFDVDKLGGKILESGVKIYGRLELGPGDYLLRVLVRNGDTGRTGVVASPLAVPRYDGTETTLLPPFFKDDPVNKWLLVRLLGEDSDGSSVVYPFTVNGEPFVPSAKPELEDDKAVDLCLMTYNLGEGSPALEAWVVGPDGAEKSAEANLALVERTVTGISGFDKLVARFRPRGLEKGDYTLRVELTDPATGAHQQKSILFQLTN